MTIKKFLIFTLAALALFATLCFTPVKSEAAQATSIKKVRGEGTSFQLKDEQEMRAGAINKALKDAIASAYESLIKDTELSEETQRRKDSVLSAPLDYILDYRVLSEGWIRHLVIEPGLPSAPPTALGSPGPLSRTGAEEAADDIFAGAGKDYNEEETEEFNTAQEQGLKLFHIWIETSVDFKQLKSDLSLTPSFEGEETSLVTILLLTVTGYDRFTKVKEAIEELKNVKEVTLDSFLRGKIVLTTEVWGNPHELLEGLRTNKALKDFDIIPSGADRITIKGVLER